MLTQLSVRNFVLIESLDLELGQGLNVLSGGSGEGKTLLLNALRFVLGHGSNGKSAAGQWVRSGAKQTKVRVVFECPEGKQVLERTLSAAGRGRCTLNDVVLPLPAFRARASRLGEFFGQGQAQRLVDAEAQRELLDAVAESRDLVQRFASEREELLARAQTHDRLAREEQALRLDWGDQQAQRDALGALSPEPDEFEELIATVDRLEAQADQASSLAALSRDLEGDEHAYDEEGLADALVSASASLAALRSAWPELEEAHETLAQAAELLQEASRGVASVRASAGFDPHELDALKRRESEFRSLARRLGLRPQDLATRWERLRTLDPEAIAEERAALAIRLRRGRTRLASLSAELHSARTLAAGRLSESVLRRLPELGLKEARFEVHVHSRFEPANTLSVSHCSQVPSLDVGASVSSTGAPTPAPLPQSSSQLSSSQRASHPTSSGRSTGEGGTGALPRQGGGLERAGRDDLAGGVAMEPELLARHPSPHGDDRVELRFSANRSLPMGTLHQASGGELGRVFLALGLEAPANAALLVFDEVDQNVGARLGSAVGACLERMSHSRQVLSITHLAPVAARARLHHRIAKRSGVTRVETLEGEARVDELALMIRGEPLTEASRAQARELLAEAQAQVRSKPKKRAPKKTSKASTSGKAKGTASVSEAQAPEPSAPRVSPRGLADDLPPAAAATAPQLKKPQPKKPTRKRSARDKPPREKARRRSRVRRTGAA